MAIFKYYLEKRRDKNGDFPTENIPIIYSFSFDGYSVKFGQTDHPVPIQIDHVLLI